MKPSVVAAVLAAVAVPVAIALVAGSHAPPASSSSSSSSPSLPGSTSSVTTRTGVRPPLAHVDSTPKLPKYSPPAGQVDDPQQLYGEEATRKRWEQRLRAENDAAIEFLKTKLGVSSAQAADARVVLDDQLAARMELTAKMRAGSVSSTNARARAIEIKKRAQDRLKAILTPEQYDGWLKLDPRQKVLDDEAAREK